MKKDLVCQGFCSGSATSFGIGLRLGLAGVEDSRDVADRREVSGFGALGARLVAAGRGLSA